MRRYLILVAALVLATFGIAQAQGTQSATLTGQVKSSDDAPLPGVTVSVKSPSMQGVRTVTTDSNGGYIFKALPPGAYTISFELSGMATIEQQRQIALGASETVDATMRLSQVEETVTVTADAPSVIEQITRGENYTNEQIDHLATPRTLQGIAELAPGLTDNTPNAGQVTISGSFAFDNVFLVNGVDVNDNLFGSPNNLFIEDAIEEVQVLTSGISAEYGRFGGGVVNAITKRGGNEFHGTARLDLTNTGWRDETPIENCTAPGQNPATCVVVDRSLNRSTGEKVPTQKTWMGTFGGPIVKDRLWFFAAGRTQPFENATTLLSTNIPYVATQDEKRFEGKLTGSINPNHTLQASYTHTKTEQTGPSLGAYAADTHTFYDPARTLPSSLMVVNYNGVLSPKLFAEVQYSTKKFKFENTGGHSTAFLDSPIFAATYSPAQYYNAPYFDSNDPEDRDNRQISGSLSYFLSTENLGRHDIKAGYEHYTSINTGGNSQSASGYVLYADYLGGVGTPTLDANGYFQPVFVSGESYAINWLPTLGAENNTVTQSFFLNDKWQVTSKLSANLGVRHERIRSEATGGIVGADTDATVPRLGLSYDVKGDGKFTLDATYAQYAGKASETQFGNNSSVGNPAYVYVLYTGPDGVGRGCAQCFNPANWSYIFGGSFPTATVRFAEGLSPAKTREFSFGAGAALPKNGYLKATFLDRKVINFFEGATDTTTGTTDVTYQGVELGTFDNTLYRNYSNEDGLMREYRHIQVQAGMRPFQRWNIQGHYTRQLRNNGNYEGEGTNTPGATTFFGDYPEIYSADRHFPTGRLNDYQKHKVRLWTNLDIPTFGVGNLNLGLLFRYDSGLTTSLTQVRAFTAQQRANFGLYAQAPGASQTVFFGERGAFEFEGSKVLDLALNYELNLFDKKIRPWVKVDIRNVLNTEQLIAHSTSISGVASSPLDSLGLPTEYTRNASFGNPRTTADYEVPREFRFSLGVRF